MYVTHITRRIERIGKDRWEKLLSDDLYKCPYGWVRAIEDSNMFDVNIICVRRHGKLAGAAICYSHTLNVEPFFDGMTRRVVRAVSYAFPRYRRVRVLNVSSPLSNFEGIFIDPAEDGAEIVPHILDAVTALGREQRPLLISIGKWESNSSDIYSRLEGRGYTATKDFPDTCLELPFDSFDGYLSGLSRNGRKQIRKKIRTGKERGLVIEKCGISDETVEAIYGLYRETYDHSERKFFSVSKEFFRSLAVIEDQVELLVARRHEETIGFILGIHQGDVLRALFAGLDYCRAPECMAYFNLNYELIECAIRNGKRRILFGIDSYTNKLRMGCRLRETRTFVRVENRAFNYAIKKFGPFLLGDIKPDGRSGV